MQPLSYYEACRRDAASLIAQTAVGLGHVATGVAIDAVLSAMGDYLRHHHGAPAAYDTFTRAAERAIAPQLSKIPPTGEGASRS